MRTSERPLIRSPPPDRREARASPWGTAGFGHHALTPPPVTQIGHGTLRKGSSPMEEWIGVHAKFGSTKQFLPVSRRPPPREPRSICGLAGVPQHVVQEAGAGTTITGRVKVPEVIQ